MKSTHILMHNSRPMAAGEDREAVEKRAVELVFASREPDLPDPMLAWTATGKLHQTWPGGRTHWTGYEVVEVAG